MQEPTQEQIEFVVPQAQAAPAAPAPPLLLVLAPIGVAVILWLLLSSPLALLFGLLSPVLALGSFADGLLRARRARRRLVRAHEQELRGAGAQLAALHDQERAAIEERWPRPGEAPAPTGELHRWRRQQEWGVRIGSGSLPSRLRVRAGPRVEGEAAELARRAAVLEAAPVVFEPARRGADPFAAPIVLGVVAEPRLGRAFARAVCLQLARDSPPQALRIELPSGPGWAGLHRLPHRERAPLTLRVHEAPAEAGAPAAGWELVLAAERAALPMRCERIVELHGAGRASWWAAPGSSCPIRPLLLGEAEAARAAARLEREAQGLPRPGAVLPASVQLAALPDPEPPSGRASLRCTVGVHAQGPLRLDLVADGPHAIVAGTTGSGKSELLVAWLSSIARSYPPEEVGFLLLDFKGESSLAPLLRLPHCLGIVSDLDENGAARAVRSIRAELRRREELLRAHRARDIAALPGQVALHRLVVVADEFAALAHALPEVHAVLGDLAARGRSLGVHLILATQSPSTAVREQLLANCALRLSLRVLAAAESQALIGTAAAAALDPAVPGRCIVRSTTQPQPVEFQCARLGALALRARSGAPPLPPWLPPLPARLSEPELLAQLDSRTSGAEPCAIPLALGDRPEEQRRTVEFWDPTRAAGLLVCGDRGSGRSAVLALLASRLRTPASRRDDSAVLPSRLLLAPAGDAEACWDAVEAAWLSLTQGPAEQGLILLLDELDVVLGRVGTGHGAELLERLALVLREGAARGAAVAATVTTVPAALQRVGPLFAERVLLAHARREAFLAAGGAAAEHDPAAPPGRGRWHGLEVQFALAEADELRGRRVQGPPPLPRQHPVVAVTAAPERLAARLSAAGWTVTGEMDARAGGPVAAVGSFEDWQLRQRELALARRAAALLLDDADPLRARALDRSLSFPPALAGPGRGVYYAPGAVHATRVLLPP